MTTDFVDELGAASAGIVRSRIHVVARWTAVVFNVALAVAIAMGIYVGWVAVAYGYDVATFTSLVIAEHDPASDGQPLPIERTAVMAALVVLCVAVVWLVGRIVGQMRAPSLEYVLLTASVVSIWVVLAPVSNLLVALGLWLCWFLAALVRGITAPRGVAAEPAVTGFWTAADLDALVAGSVVTLSRGSAFMRCRGDHDGRPAASGWVGEDGEWWSSAELLAQAAGPLTVCHPGGIRITDDRRSHVR